MSLVSNVARAESPKDSGSIDVLGFKIGMPSDKVRELASKSIKDATFEVQQGTLSLGKYKSPEMVFGIEVSSGRDNHYQALPNQEFVFFVFEQKEPYKTIWLSRKHVYAENDTSTVSNMVAALTEKYGKADSGTAMDMFWTFASEKAPSATACQNAINILGFAGNLYHGQFANNPDERIQNCGTWMRAQIRPLASNKELVGSIEVTLGDVTAMRKSMIYTFDFLKKNADAAAKGDVEKSSKKKPEL